MANPEHVKALASGAAGWSAWRAAHARGPRRVTAPDLRRARLHGRDLRDFDLRRADLRDADLRSTSLRRAQLSEADLRGADLRLARAYEADLSHADLRGADLRRARLEGARMDSARLDDADLRGAFVTFVRLSGARLERADLRGADLRCSSLRRASLRDAKLQDAVLRHTSLADADLAGADLAGAEVYGAGVWGVQGTPRSERGLVIAPHHDSPRVTIDDLDTAQLLFVLLDNARIAHVIDAASSRVVLLLGRFTPRRKAVLDGVKAWLLAHQLVPVVFDFAPADRRDLTETVATLASMSCFVIADLTDARSIPQELSHIVPLLPSVPVAPILAQRRGAYAMFEHFARYPWVRPVVRYRSLAHLESILLRSVVLPAWRDAMHARARTGRRAVAASPPWQPARGRR